jgi:hypothetical protein
MGQQTYGESASAEKIAREEAKYPPQKEIGFRIAGFSVCLQDPVHSDYTPCLLQDHWKGNDTALALLMCG